MLAILKHVLEYLIPFFIIFKTDENKRHTAESQSSSSTSQLASKLQNILPENLSTILISFHREEDAIFSDTSSIKENQQYIHKDLTFSTSTSSMSKAYAKAFSSTTIGIGYKNLMFKELDIELPNEVRELNQMLASKMTQDVNDEDDSESFARIMDIMVPSNALRKRDHIQFSKFFQKACTGTEGDTSEHLKRMKQKPLISVPNELKVICMEVVQSLKRESDLESLSAALAYTDRNECESKSVLRCRLHRRIAALHYCNGDLLDAREHLDTAIQQTELITPNVDTVYTLRLKAFILYKEYKEGNNELAYKESEQYFMRMMSHVRQQPQKMRIMTERTKINKARFHLDMIEDYRCKGKSVEAMEQLYYRAQETLQDIDLKYLTEADKKTFHTTCKEFELYSSSFL